MIEWASSCTSVAARTRAGVGGFGTVDGIAYAEGERGVVGLLPASIGARTSAASPAPRGTAPWPRFGGAVPDGSPAAVPLGAPCTPCATASPPPGAKRRGFTRRWYHK